VAKSSWKSANQSKKGKITQSLIRQAPFPQENPTAILWMLRKVRTTPDATAGQAPY